MELDYSFFNLNFLLRIFSLENESAVQAQTRSKIVTSKFKYKNTIFAITL